MYYVLRLHHTGFVIGKLVTFDENEKERVTKETYEESFNWTHYNLETGKFFNDETPLEFL
jgi:hypothetical protein